MKTRETAVKADCVYKKFKLYSDRPLTLKESLVRGGKGAYREFFALSDVSFEIYRGSTVGLIGQNGCGKSTMLKIINRTMFPNSGKLEVHGKVSSLIELGAGFHPDLSGRENIYTNATIFGLTRAEIERRLPEIIAFSELEQFIDNPVRTYSSGMYARLAFSVAIHVDAEILLIDEILGVGDMNFQKKCANRIYEMRRSGMTIVLVTHDMDMIDRLCDHVIWFDHGHLRGQGPPKEMQSEYLAHMAGEQERVRREETARVAASAGPEPAAEPHEAEQKRELETHIPGAEGRFGNREVEITAVRLLDDAGEEKQSFCTGDCLRVQLDYSCAVPPEQLRPNIGVEFSTEQGVYIYGTNTAREGIEVSLQRTGTLEVRLDALPLLPGDYTIGVAIDDVEEKCCYDHYQVIARFKMYSPIHDVGVVRLPHRFLADAAREERE